MLRSELRTVIMTTLIEVRLNIFANIAGNGAATLVTTTKCYTSSSLRWPCLHPVLAPAPVPALALGAQNMDLQPCLKTQTSQKKNANRIQRDS